MADGEINVCLFNGGIRNSEQEYMARLLRQKSKILVAFGSCASEGCIPGLGNLDDRKSIFADRLRPRFGHRARTIRRKFIRSTKRRCPKARSICRCSTTP